MLEISGEDYMAQWRVGGRGVVDGGKGGHMYGDGRRADFGW